MIANYLDRQSVIDIYKEAGKPLDVDILSALADVDDLGHGFTILDSQCRVCNYRSVIICPSVCDLDNLECSNCGCMSVQEREVPEYLT